MLNSLKLDKYDNETGSFVNLSQPSKFSSRRLPSLPKFSQLLQLLAASKITSLRLSSSPNSCGSSSNAVLPRWKEAVPQALYTRTASILLTWTSLKTTLAISSITHKTSDSTSSVFYDSQKFCKEFATACLQSLKSTFSKF